MAHRPRKPTTPAVVPRLHDTVRLSAVGLAKVLGDLEARVLRTVWALGRPASARLVHEVVAEEHEVALLTVVTVLNKLVEKGILTRAKRDDLYHYDAVWSREAFVAHASRRVVEGVLPFAPAAMLASFVDVLAERDPDRLAELARLVRRKMREQANG